MSAGQFPASLSERELEVLDLVATGLTNLEIAQRLEISKRTVDNHISKILTKTRTENRVELVRWALQWGKVCLNDVNCCPLPGHRIPRRFLKSFPRPSVEQEASHFCN